MDDRGIHAMDQFTRRAVFVLYVILFLLSTITMSMVQISINESTSYKLNIEYEQDTMTAYGFDIDHSSTPIRVDVLIMIDNYESTLSGFRIGGFPLWVDTSYWTEGETVDILGNLYLISSERGYWKAHRSLGDDQSESLYYHKILGIFIERNTDRLTLGTSGFNGYTVNIQIQQSNIDGFVSRVTGSNIAGNVVLLSSIFTEVLIVQRLLMRRKESRHVSGK
ncbi:MAG: hypothetical protein ACFFDQ_02430 [Candidatus Thorarchaeota archaeon]